MSNIFHIFLKFYLILLKCYKKVEKLRNIGLIFIFILQMSNIFWRVQTAENKKRVFTDFANYSLHIKRFFYQKFLVHSKTFQKNKLKRLFNENRDFGQFLQNRFLIFHENNSFFEDNGDKKSEKRMFFKQTKQRNKKGRGTQACLCPDAIKG